jgi:acyl-CoA synthetase (AMP-forming)/AMP-acid ligase II
MLETLQADCVDPNLTIENDVLVISGADSVDADGSHPAGFLHDALLRASVRGPEHPALLFDQDSISYAELAALARSIAAALCGRGVGAGARVAVMSANRPEFIATVNALSMLGAVTVLFSPAWKGREVAHAVALTEPSFAVADGDSVSLLSEYVTDVLDLDEGHFPSAADAPATPPASRPADDAVFVFSSGTVGLPKAVRHTHESLGHAVRHWLQCLDLTADDRFQVATPPSHILGLLNLLTAAAAGATVRLHRRFDLDAVLRHIQDDRMTLEMAVAPIALAMASHPALESYDLSSLRYIMWGATPVTASVAQTVTARTGVRWLAAYGASEVPVIAVNPVRHPERWRLDSPGVPPIGVRLRIAEDGEIQVLSPSAMAGYLPADADAEAFTADGWYRTGDIGTLEPDDTLGLPAETGWVRITDRSKEMLKVNGFPVAPAEIESVLLGHRDVLDCAVFGVQDERVGERPVAAVVLAAGSATTAEDLQALVAESLATYKHLRSVVLVDAIPRLPSGKALRRNLRADWEPILTIGSEQ